MKVRSYVLFYLAALICLNAKAQLAPTPLEAYAKENNIAFLTASNGRYQEVFTNPKLKRMGSVMFNTETNKVAYFIPENDTAFENAYTHSFDNSRFLSVDPLTKSFPSLTPYQYASNSPIANIDLDGLEAYFYMLQWNKSANTFQLINHKTVDAKMQTIVGNVNLNMIDLSFVYGTDGHWHQIPKEWESKSFSEAGDYKAVFKMINSWKMSDEAYEGALKGEALQNIGNTAASAVMLADGIKNLGGLYKTLAKSDRLKVFMSKLGKAPGAKNQDEAIQLINNSLDEVEDMYSGVKKADGIPNRDDGRMYGILDEKYVKTLEDGTKIANTKGNRIVLKTDGGFDIQTKDGSKTLFSKPGAKTE